VNVQVALLRAVNVGGTAKLSMPDLRELATNIGMKSVRTLLQSGNLLFDAGRKTPAAAEKLLEGACARKFGLATDIHVRTAAEIDEIAAHNPFPREARDNPGHLVVLFMRTAPDADAFTALQEAIKGRERVRGGGRHAYISYPEGIGRSKLTGAMIERFLGTAGTGRNWNTVLKLAAATKE
jgi:uncharacterized protein (DUF1697 family)